MSSKKILLLAFIEGVSVMLIELLGGKMLIPYFGNSLIIWTSTIGITMLSLMVGYFLGGKLSKNKNALYYLFSFFIITSCWVAIMPLVGPKTLVITSDMDLYNASFFSSILLLSFPLVLLGSCPPIFIEKYTESNAGAKSGKVFALSTIGGILCALVFGFIVLPKFGVSFPIVIYSYVLFFISVFVFWKTIKDKTYFVLALVPLVLFSVLFYRAYNKKEPLYLSESLQGQLMIQDQGQGEVFIRSLFINGIAQTRAKIFQNSYFNESIWWYVHFDGAVASVKPEGSDVLLMGFGGGSIAHELIKLKFKIDVVEIDERLPGIAHDYFFVDTTKLNFTIDDARHFIKTHQKTTKKYDLVVVDLLHGEVQPNHIFTVEGLKELRSLIKDDAIILVNYQSNFDEPKRPVVSILKTFVAAGFDAVVSQSKMSRPDDYIVVASPSTLPIKLFNDNHMNDCCFNNKEVNVFRQYGKFLHLNDFPDTDNLTTLRDNYPILEILNEESTRSWRENTTKSDYKQDNFLLFK